MRISTGVAATAALTLTLAGSACTSSRDRCHGIESEFIPGLFPTGMAVGASGLGYLDAYAAFGDCFGSYESKLFRFDESTRTATTTTTDYLLGRVVLDSAGEGALAMGYVDPYTNGIMGGYPLGARLLDGAQDLGVDLGGSAWDIEASPGGGWIVASEGGGWRVDPSGSATLLHEGPSYCAAQWSDTTYFCTDDGVAVSGSAGSWAAIQLAEHPSAIAAFDGGVVLVLDDSVAIARGGIIDLQVSVNGGGGQIWLTPNGKKAVIRKSTDRYVLDVGGGLIDHLSASVLTDVAFSEDSRFAVFAQEASLGVLDLESGEAGSHNFQAPGDVFVSRLGPRRFLRAEGGVGKSFHPGDTVSGAFRAFEIIDEKTLSIDAPWDLIVEE